MSENSARSPALLNSASFGEPDSQTASAMQAHIQIEQEIGVVAAREAYDLSALREDAADLLGASSDNVAFQNSTGDGWCSAALALPLKGRKALITPWEWGAQGTLMQRLGLELIVMPTVDQADGTRLLDFERIGGMIDDDVAVISAPMVSSVTGVTIDVAQLGALTRPDHCWFMVDGAQAIGHVPIDMAKINCDVFAATTRKWIRGPAGTGLLALSDRVLSQMKPILTPGHGGLTWDNASSMLKDIVSARRFEKLDRSDAARVGLGVAIKTALSAGVQRMNAIKRNAERVRRGLSELDACHVFPSSGGSVSFRMAQPALHGLMADALIKDGILISQPVPHYEPWSDVNEPVLRISPAAEASTDVIDLAIARIADVAAQARNSATATM